jgi:PncC family amidohydrolase
MNTSTIAQQVGTLLRQHQRTVCTAESCTGGLIAHLLTDIPGSSDYLLGGIVAYSNTLKVQLLAVREQTLIAYGAVSAPTAREMAVGARMALGTDYALSVTGIAGPGGGTDLKPVGLTYIALAGPNGLLVVDRRIWSGNRVQNKQASAEAALYLLLSHI